MHLLDEFFVRKLRKNDFIIGHLYASFQALCAGHYRVLAFLYHIGQVAENALLKCDLVNDENDWLFVFDAPLRAADGNALVRIAARI
ncbi:MAG: hypothetical protein ACREIP_07745 [Alphaproteobacteria bacterium]